MNDWTWRDTVASWFYRIANRFSPDPEHDLFIRDADGKEIFSIAFTGGFVATGPWEPYTVHARHYDGDDDYEGTVEDW